MWTRKSALEIKNLLDQKEIQKKSLKRPIIVGTIFGLLFMIVTYFGFRGGARGYYIFTHQTGFNLKTFYFGVVGFVVFFGLAFYHQRKGSSFLSEEKYLRCDACNELSPANAENECQCGGRLEPSEYYSWEE